MNKKNAILVTVQLQENMVFKTENKDINVLLVEGVLVAE
jgi:hypothetical protein